MVRGLGPGGMDPSSMYAVVFAMRIRGVPASPKWSIETKVRSKEKKEAKALEHSHSNQQAKVDPNNISNMSQNVPGRMFPSMVRQADKGISWPKNLGPSSSSSSSSLLFPLFPFPFPFPLFPFPFPLLILSSEARRMVGANVGNEVVGTRVVGADVGRGEGTFVGAAVAMVGAAVALVGPTRSCKKTKRHR